MRMRRRWLGVAVVLCLGAPASAWSAQGPPSTPARAAADGGSDAQASGGAASEEADATPPAYVEWFLRMRRDLAGIGSEADALRLRLGRLNVTAQAHLSQRLDDILARQVELGQQLDQLQQLPWEGWKTRYRAFETQVAGLRDELDGFETTLGEWGA